MSIDELNEVEIIEAGIFSWDVRTNLLYGDSAVAKHFGLRMNLVGHGLPLDRYLQRIHEEDRPSVLAAIRDAIVSRNSFHAECRTLSADDEWASIMAFGHCFLDHDGVPLVFSGIIYPVVAAAGADDALTWHLLAAHETAKAAGKPDVAAGILNILSKLARSSESAETDRHAVN